MFPYKVGYPRQEAEETTPRPTLYSVTRQPSGYAVCRDGAIVKTGCTHVEAEAIVRRLRAMDGIRSRDSLTEPAISSPAPSIQPKILSNHDGHVRHPGRTGTNVHLSPAQETTDPSRLAKLGRRARDYLRSNDVEARGVL